MTAFWPWNAWKGFRHNPWYSFCFTFQNDAASPKKLSQIPSYGPVSCWLTELLQQHVLGSLSSLDYAAFNETRVRFLFTWASAIQKIHSSLLYNHFNGKKWPLTERSLWGFFFWHLHWELSKDTAHGGTQWSGCRVNWSFFSFPNNHWPLQTEPVLCLWRSLLKLEGGSGGEEEEAVLGISAPRPEWTPDRLFWPSPGHQNKRTQRHINHHMG